MEFPNVERFLSAVQTLPTNRPLSKEDLLTDRFLMEKDERIEMYYAPHNEYINEKAKIVFVGITPGFHQMKTAFEQWIRSKNSGSSLEMCLKDAKREAGFAGSMRNNLIQMLDELWIPEGLNLSEAADLFGGSRHLIHTTSVIKYPTFVKGKNYTGHQPPIHRSHLLKHYAYNVFPDELSKIDSHALLIPLGKTVEQVMATLVQENKWYGHDYLIGLPHPSGANGHRVKQFQQQKESLQNQIRVWVEKRDK